MKRLRRNLLTGAILLLASLLAAPVQSAEMTMGEAINKAGRQRMLTQRIVKSYAQMGQDVRYRVAEKDLRDSIVLFESQLQQLKGFTKDRETQRGLLLVERLWKPVLQIASAKIERERAEELRQDAEKLLVAAHQVVLQLEDLSASSKGHLVNIAGRQRMLSQRMGNLYMLMSWGFDNLQYKADYDKAVKEFQDALEELTNAPENTPEIKKALGEVHEHWEVYKLSNRMGEGEYVPGLVARMLDHILHEMNEITGMYAELHGG